jgi:hypothetical protein
MINQTKYLMYLKIWNELCYIVYTMNISMVFWIKFIYLLK